MDAVCWQSHRYNKCREKCFGWHFNKLWWDLFSFCLSHTESLLLCHLCVAWNKGTTMSRKLKWTITVSTTDCRRTRIWAGHMLQICHPLYNRTITVLEFKDFQGLMKLVDLYRIQLQCDFQWRRNRGRYRLLKRRWNWRRHLWSCWRNILENSWKPMHDYPWPKTRKLIKWCWRMILST